MSKRGEYIEALAQFYEGGDYPEFADYGLDLADAVRCEAEALDRADQINTTNNNQKER